MMTPTTDHLRVTGYPDPPLPIGSVKLIALPTDGQSYDR